jgi:hypothetical protein
MAKVIEFDYNTFYNYYKQLGHQADEIHFQQYIGKKVHKKDGSIIPFSVERFQTFRIPDSDPLIVHYPTYFNYGGFISLPPEPNKKQAIYILHPELKQSRLEDKYNLLCDHLSYIIDSVDRKKPLHFHQTFYSPVTDSCGKTDRYDNYLPTSFSFSQKTFESHLQNKLLQKQSAFLYSIFSKPWVAPQTPLHALTGSGVGQALSKPKHRRSHSLQQTHSARFIKLWQSLPLKQVTVIALPSPNKPQIHDVTVILHDRLKHQPGALRTAVHLEVDSSRARNRKQLEADIAKAMKGLAYNDFRDPKDPDSDDTL